MISGAHVMIFTQDEAADRAFLRDVLEIPCIDSGGGWLIFKLPVAEAGVHPLEGPNMPAAAAEVSGSEFMVATVWLMVDDIEAAVGSLRAAGAPLRNEIVQGQGGRQVLVDDPSGNPVEIFEPR